MNDKRLIKGSHINMTVPLSLFLLGAALIAGGLYLMLKPYFAMSSVIIGASSSSTPAKLQSKSVPFGTIKYSAYGAVMGHLTIKSVSIENCPVYHGDGEVQLRNGIGQFTGGLYPGEGGKIVLDAHRESYFKNLKAIRVGDKVDFTTAYGSYTYKVNAIKILSDSDKSIIAPDKAVSVKHEYLVMYTCYPFDTIGYHPQRYVVYADFVNGTKVRIPTLAS